MATPTRSFASLDRLSTAQLSRIESIHADFLARTTANLATLVRNAVEGTIEGIEQSSFGDSCRGLPAHSCALEFSLAPQGGSAYVHIAPEHVGALLEALLGADVSEQSALSRDLTDLEKHLLGGPGEMFARDLTASWSSCVGVQFRLVHIATDPQSIRISSPGEAVAVVKLALNLAGRAARFAIIVPSSLIRVGTSVAAPAPLASDEDQSKMLERLHTCPLDFDIRLIGQSLRIRDLLSLRPGDVVGFSHAGEEALACFVNGELKFSGHILVSGGKRQFAVESAC